MSKQIRPLSAYKKQNPDLYKIVASILREESKSKKAQENNWYWSYAFFEIFFDVTTEEDRDKNKNGIVYEAFFWKTPNNRNNIGTITEMGRLFLAGWYYNIEDWTKEIGLYVYRSYHKKEEKGDSFNDLEFKEAVKHIRDNIGYYYHNKEELKLYILETFFKEDLKPLLPDPPKKLKRYNKIVDLINDIRKNQRKKGIDYWIEEAESWESYAYYLQGILEDYYIEYLEEKEFRAKETKEGKEYIEEIDQLREEYRKITVKTASQIPLLEGKK